VGSIGSPPLRELSTRRPDCAHRANRGAREVSEGEREGVTLFQRVPPRTAACSGAMYLDATERASEDWRWENCR
jgi:hypothetical protein